MPISGLDGPGTNKKSLPHMTKLPHNVVAAESGAEHSYSFIVWTFKHGEAH